MNKLTDLVEEISQDISSMTFSEVIRNARDKVGLRQYKVAEHIRMTPSRLKNLESGYFRGIPQADEIRSLCSFYSLDYEEMLEKAEQQVAAREVRKLYG